MLQNKPLWNIVQITELTVQKVTLYMYSTLRFVVLVFFIYGDVIVFVLHKNK